MVQICGDTHLRERSFKNNPVYQFVYVGLAVVLFVLILEKIKRVVPNYL